MTITTIPLFGDDASNGVRQRRPRPRATATSPSPSTPTPDSLISVTDAADLLGVGRSKLYELMNRGVIASVKIDRCRRIRRSEVDRFIAALPPALD